MILLKNKEFHRGISLFSEFKTLGPTEYFFKVHNTHLNLFSIPISLDHFKYQIIDQ